MLKEIHIHYLQCFFIKEEERKQNAQLIFK